MDAQTQGGSTAGQGHRLLKRGAGDHYRGRPDQSLCHPPFHRPVDQDMTAKIISIDNQLFGHDRDPFKEKQPGLAGTNVVVTIYYIRWGGKFVED